MSDLRPRVRAFVDWLNSVPPSPPFHTRPDFAQFADLTDAEMILAEQYMRRTGEALATEAAELQQFADTRSVANVVAIDVARLGRDDARLKVIAKTTELFANSFFDIAQKFASTMGPSDALMSTMNGAVQAIVHTLYTLDRAGKIEGGREMVDVFRDNMATAWAARETLEQNPEVTIQ